MHALIIEDHPVLANFIEVGLSDFGFTSFSFAADETSAVSLATKRRPTLVTADHKLESGTGIGAVASIRKLYPVPVIYIVGNPNWLGTQAKVDVILLKPFTLSQLERAVQTALGRNDSSWPAIIGP